MGCSHSCGAVRGFLNLGLVCYQVGCPATLPALEVRPYDRAMFFFNWGGLLKGFGVDIRQV